MLVFNLFLFVSFAVSSAVSSVIVKLASNTTCRVDEFACPDGSCVSVASVCDGARDCADGSDELPCYSDTNRNLTEAVVSHWRSKRQARCGLYQWRCADGQCIDIDGHCDGKIDCRDKSDESHPECRNKQCQPNWFQCTYGACVDGTAPCNNITECADQSDELLSSCPSARTMYKNGKFLCSDGSTIESSEACDGVANCTDGSDETVAACTGQPCQARLFRCAYGACVDQGSNCNGIRECADGSDEAEGLCKGTGPPVTEPTLTYAPGTSGDCVLPEYPEHGKYVVANSPHSQPGHRLSSFALLNYTCDEGYGLLNDTQVVCRNGSMPRSLPECVQFCRLFHDESVRYDCEVPNSRGGLRDCREFEPPGTVVKPECSPDYYLNDDLYQMKCQNNGYWNRHIVCKRECGRVTSTGQTLVYGGNSAKHGELPWFVGIYQKGNNSVHIPICGGSLVSNGVVISAGHCFWDNRGRPELFSAATAKLYRKWDHEYDTDVQKSEIKAIHLSEYYSHAVANYQSDIAVLILKKPFVYNNYVSRVCLDFTRTFNDQQLEAGNKGKVAGFGYTTSTGKHSTILKVVELPYVPIKECQKIIPDEFIPKITPDKICAGYSNGTAALCKGDSGGGLVFPDTERGIKRYFLRGVVSTAPASDDKCNTVTIITFTSIIAHKDFINKYL